MTDRRSGRASAAFLVALTVVLVAPPAGAAERESTEQVRALARRATSDPAALRELRQVRQVDGRPVDLGRALDGDGEAVAGRLRALAEDGSGQRATDVAPAAARRDARQILESRKFQPAHTPRPFRGLLRRIGGWLRPLLERLDRRWDGLWANALGRAVLAGGVVAAAVATSLVLVSRRGRAGVRRTRSERRGRRDDPAELERRADAAERAGQLDLAFRLRFRAGLLRLDGEGALTYRPSLTTGELVRHLRSSTFADLAVAFDEIAYGGRPADEEDLDAARRGWPRVLEEVGRP